MGTKQVKVYFLIIADNRTSADVTISVGGVQKWSGALAHTNDTIPVFDTVISSFSTAEFDLEAADRTPHCSPAVNEDITITVTGGSAVFNSMFTNYNLTADGAPGGATDWLELFPTAQPTWDAIPLYSRMNYADGANGPMLFYSGEILAFPVLMPIYQ